MGNFCCDNPQKLKWQICAAMSASLSFLMTGAVRGYSSPSLPSMIRDDVFVVDSFFLSLLTSLPAVGSLSAALLSGIFLQYLGRRRTLIFTSIPWSASFLMVAFSGGDRLLLYVGRVMMGAMVGLSVPAAQIYIAECSSPRVRGAFSSLTALFLAFGILITYITGAFVEWNTLAWILSTFPVLLMTSMLMMPESPTWLLSNGRDNQAKLALQMLRGYRTDIEPEWCQLRDNIRQSSRESTNKAAFWRRPTLTFTWNPTVWKPFTISLVIMILQQFSGINVVIYNTVLIFESAGVDADSSFATIIIGLIQLGATFISTFLVDRAGRRMLLLISGAGMAASMASLGYHFFNNEFRDGIASEQCFGWLPLASLGTFVFSYSIGYSNVPYVVMGELFPLKYRNLFGALTMWINLSSLFIVLFTFPEMQLSLGSHGTYWFYGACNLVGILFVFFCLPETKGKTLLEIETIFQSGPVKPTATESLKFDTAHVVDYDSE